MPLVGVRESVLCDQSDAFPVWGLLWSWFPCVLIGMWSSLGACQAGSELEKRCASVLVMWIVCELCCWSVLGLLCSERGALAHAWGMALTVSQ